MLQNMPLSGAERARRHRERNLETLRVKQRERRKATYIPAGVMKRDDFKGYKKLKEENNKRQKICRYRKKIDSVSSITSSTMKKVRTRISRQVSQKNQTIRKLENKLQDEKRNRWRLEKRLSRQSRKDQIEVVEFKTWEKSIISTESSNSPHTKKYDIIKKKRKAIKSLTNARHAILKRQVIQFLEREDNSRLWPGKNDVIRLSKDVKVQKRTLKDFMHNLHHKFLDENPTTKISCASFCKKRPKYIIPVSLTKRNICLCMYCQNMALKLTC